MIKKINLVNKKTLIIVVASVLTFFFILGAFAGVNYLGNNIATSYSSGDKITGNIRLSFANYPGDKLLTSNFEGNITLIELLRSQNLVEGDDYTCSPIGCLNSYSSSGIVNQLTINDKGNFVGFGIDGNGISVTDAKITINTNAPSSCSPNIYVDVLGDQSEILTSDKGNGESCGIKHTGCYNTSNTNEAPIVLGKEYCEKINVPASPAKILGGKIRQGTGSSNLTMKLYNLAGSLLGSCRLPQNSQNLDELSCAVNYSSHSYDDYYVCITTTVSNNYKIGRETSEPNCGTAQGFGYLNNDFDLFAETVKYAPSPQFVINETTYRNEFGTSLKQQIDNYIQSNYEGNCQLSTCFIPIKIFGANQQAVFNNHEISYESFGVPSYNQQIFELNNEYPKLTADNLTIDLSYANFIIPINSKETKFKLYIDSSKLFEKDISITKGLSFDISPKIVAFGQNTKFSIISTDKINRSIWDFGDGTLQQAVNGDFTSHSFTGNSSYFDVNITAISNQSTSTKQFRIFVGSPRDIANQTISDYKMRISNVTSQISLYPSWISQRIKETLNIDNITSGLNSLELSYNSASTEQDYQNIMLQLIDLDVPAYISNFRSGDNIPLSSGYESFNMNYISQIENKQIGDSSALRDQVVAWMNDNYNPKISFKKIEAVKDTSDEFLGTLFTIQTNPISSVAGPAYLIFGNDIENAGVYKQDYNLRSLSSGIDYLVLDSNPQTFEFFIDGNIDPETLGAYISPSLDLISFDGAPFGECNLNNICDPNENSNSCPEDCSKPRTGFLIIGWILILIFGFVAYIFLQEWYKKNYQKSLFSESNELYNLINFIYNSRKSGLQDKDIKSKLKQQKWSSEKVDFAFKKIDGKRTGMFEIPIFRKKEHNETIKQISQRQPGGVINARFIKRPSFQ